MKCFSLHCFFSNIGVVYSCPVSLVSQILKEMYFFVGDGRTQSWNMLLLTERYKIIFIIYSTDGIDELPNVAHGIRDTGKITSLDFREDAVKLCFSVMKGHVMGRSTRIITSRQNI